MDELSLEAIVCFIVLIKRKRKRHYLTKISLNPPSKSSWSALYDAKRDGAYIDTMGFDVASFHILHNELQKLFPKANPSKGGRPATLDTFACLGTPSINAYVRMYACAYV